MVKDKIFRNCLLFGMLFLFVNTKSINAQTSSTPGQSLVKERWIYTYNLEASFLDEAKAVIYGEDANIYAVGGTKGFVLESFDYFTVISLDTNGNERWKYFYNRSNGKAPDLAYDVVYGENDYIYAAGITCSLSAYPCTLHKQTLPPPGPIGGPTIDFTVIKLDTDGNEQWVYKYRNACAFSVDFDHYDNNAYVAGMVWGKEHNGIIVISLDSNGNERWVYTHDYQGHAKKIIYGEDGNLYVVGQSKGETNNLDFTVISLDTNGNERWVYKYDGSGGEIDVFDLGRSIVYGLDNNLYAAGRLIEPTGPDFTIISLDRFGNERWVYKYDGPAKYWDEAFSIACDSSGKLYAAGCIYDTISTTFAVMSLSTNGNKNWLYTHSGPCLGANNQANSIACGLNENIYATGLGSFDTTNFWYDFAVVCLSNTGKEKWIYNFDGTASCVDEGNSIVFGTDGYVYAAGYNTDSITGRDFTVISLPLFQNMPPDTNEPFAEPMFGP